MFMNLLQMKIAFILVVISAVMIFLSSWTFRRTQKIAGANELSVYLLLSGFYISGYALEITGSTLEAVFWALRIQYFGLAFITLSVFHLSVRFITGKSVPSAARVLLSIIPVVTLLAVLVVDRHSLFYSEAHISENGLFPVLRYTPGPLYLVFFAYNFVLTLVSEVLFFRGVLKSEGEKKKQSLLVFIAGLIPLITTAVFPERFRGVDLLPFALFSTGVFIFIALFRFHMLEIIPKARDIAVDSIDELLLVLDSSGRIRELNSSAQSSPLFDDLKVGDSLPEGSPVGTCFSAMSCSEDGEQDSTCKFEFKERNYDLRIYPIDEEFRPVKGWVMIIRDVTTTVRLLQDLEHQAIYDELTGLYNRRHILNLAAREVELARRSGARIGILLMDIDKFKLLNDSFGHLAGDAVLKKCADALTAVMRVSDLIGRYGGEEFIIICPNSDRAVSALIAERLREALERMNVRYDGNNLLVTASFGVESISAGPDTGLDELISAADKALYKAKRRGRNRVEVV